MPDEIVARVIVDLEDQLQKRLFYELTTERQISIAELLSSDDATDLITILDTELSKLVLTGISTEKRQHVSELMQYDEATAGGIMD